jgi:hypothetical protein
MLRYIFDLATRADDADLRRILAETASSCRRDRRTNGIAANIG